MSLIIVKIKGIIYKEKKRILKYEEPRPIWGSGGKLNNCKRPAFALKGFGEAKKGGGGMKNITKTVLTATTITAVLLPVLALAVVLPTPTPPISGGPEGAVDLSEIQSLIERVANFLIIISVIIAVIFIIWGGMMYMAARGNEEQAGKAKTTIFNGIIGALVVLGVGVILQTLAGVITRSFFT